MLKKFASRLIKFLKQSPSNAKVYNSEEEYYEYLFTKSGFYSSVNLNEEEKTRWDHIKSLLDTALTNEQRSKFDKILDYGCGRGWLSNELSAFGNVTGIEPVEAVVKYGRKLYKGLDLQCGKLEILASYKPEIIVCSEVIEHINSNQQLYYFQAFQNCLKGKIGYLIITTPRGEALEEWKKYLDPSQPIEEWLTEAEIRSLAETAGFTVIDKLTYSVSPKLGVEPIEIYQQWLFKITN